ncbi:MAG: DUF4232 domain-containing protein, partial [Streptosporangiaceae bacterium]
MARLVRVVIAVLVVLLPVSGCGAVRGHPVPSGARSSPVVRKLPVPWCRAGSLVLRPGAGVVSMTGEHAVMYALANRGQACALKGYPRVLLYDPAGRVLPFRYAYGGGAYVTAASPATVVLAPGASAYLLVAKYRCDLGIEDAAAEIRITLRLAHGAPFTAREPVAVTGPAGLSYCRGGQ